MRHSLAGLTLALLLCLFFDTASADEGMWLLHELDSLNWNILAERGMGLTAADIYNPDEKTIADAICAVAGGSGAFVSNRGLIITNHHVAFGAIQRQSTHEKNYIRDGFIPRFPGEELPAIGYNVWVVEKVEDVTDDILSAVTDDMSPLERYETIEHREKEIVRAAEQGKDVRCEVASFYGGSEYVLYTYFKIKDVRLVMAPPDMIGGFGGEIDNWMWPRHAGDFALMRAYVAPDGSSAEYNDRNIPYQPRNSLALSRHGVLDGDLVFVIGFPGRTNRYASSSEITEKVLHDFPIDISLRRDLLGILDSISRVDPSQAIRIESRISGVANYYKKYQAVLDGFRRWNLLSMKLDEEKDLISFLESDGTMSARFGGVLPALDSLTKVYASYREKQRTIKWLLWASDYLDAAGRIYKWSLEMKKADIDREPGYQTRDSANIARSLRDMQVNMSPDVDRALVRYLIAAARNLPEEQSISALADLLSLSDSALDQRLTSMYSTSRVGDPETRLAMFGRSEEELLSLDDPFISLAALLQPEQQAIDDLNDAVTGAMIHLRPLLIQAYRTWGHALPYPDATGTVRLGFGTVMGYSPQDAVWCDWVTSLSGTIAKHTGVEPFDVPDELLAVYRDSSYNQYTLDVIGDVPVDFLATLDITNGNSGSAVMNGRGELVGLAFDSNYEGIASDYHFITPVTRSVIVDVRYILFLLDKVYHQHDLLEELTIH